jgi:hypothetical protein
MGKSPARANTAEDTPRNAINSRGSLQRLIPGKDPKHLGRDAMARRGETIDGHDPGYGWKTGSGLLDALFHVMRPRAHARSFFPPRSRTRVGFRKQIKSVSLKSGFHAIFGAICVLLPGLCVFSPCGGWNRHFRLSFIPHRRGGAYSASKFPKLVPCQSDLSAS